MEVTMDFLSSTSVNLIYLVLLILGLIYAVFLLVTGHFVGDADMDLGGHGVDIHADVHAETADGTHGISPISPLTIATFITAFGAIGLVSTGLFDASDRISLIWAALGGFVFSVLVYFAFTYLFIKPQGSSEVHVAELAGHTAQVITPIPADGMGEVAMVSQGGRVVYSARSDQGDTIEQGASVRVVRVAGGIAYVERE
jgi:membrane protein implicated in regulation of membrane protease activity